MDRVQTYAPLQEILDVELNDLQDNALGIAQTPGLLVGAGLCGGSSSAITLSAITTLVIGSAVLAKSTVTNLSSADAVGGAFVASAWHYIFAFNNSGSIGFEITSVTAPDTATMVWKLGGTTHRFITCFYATSTTALTPFAKTPGRYTYRGSRGCTPAPYTSGSYGLVTAQPIAAPPHARQLLVAVEFDNTPNTGSNGDVSVRYVGDATTQRKVLECYDVAPRLAYATFPIVTNATGFDASVTATGQATFSVLEFAEP